MKNSIILIFGNTVKIFSEMLAFSSDQIKCLMRTRHLLSDWHKEKTTEGYAMLLCH